MDDEQPEYLLVSSVGSNSTSSTPLVVLDPFVESSTGSSEETMLTGRDSIDLHLIGDRTDVDERVNDIDIHPVALGADMARGHFDGGDEKSCGGGGSIMSRGNVPSGVQHVTNILSTSADTIAINNGTFLSNDENPRNHVSTAPEPSSSASIKDKVSVNRMLYYTKQSLGSDIRGDDSAHTPLQIVFPSGRCSMALPVARKVLAGGNHGDNSNARDRNHLAGRIAISSRPEHSDDCIQKQKTLCCAFQFLVVSNFLFTCVLYGCAESADGSKVQYPGTLFDTHA